MKKQDVSTAARRGGIAATPPGSGSFAIEYLNVMMEDADQDELVAALIRVARACGGRRLVEKIELNATALFRTLCMRGNPELKSAAALLKAMGIRLTIQPIARSAAVVPAAAGSRSALSARPRALARSAVIDLRPLQR